VVILNEQQERWHPKYS